MRVLKSLPGFGSQSLWSQSRQPSTCVEPCHQDAWLKQAQTRPGWTRSYTRRLLRPKTPSGTLAQECRLQHGTDSQVLQRRKVLTFQTGANT